MDSGFEYLEMGVEGMEGCLKLARIFDGILEEGFHCGFKTLQKLKKMIHGFEYWGKVFFFVLDGFVESEQFGEEGFEHFKMLVGDA